MKSCLCVVFLLFAAGCSSSPANSSAQLNERDPACAECAPGCCQEGAKAAAPKSECCAGENAAKPKSECCAGENAAKKQN